MKDTILISMLIWAISALIARRQVFEEGNPLWIILLRLVLAPLMLVVELTVWIWIEIRTALKRRY